MKHKLMKKTKKLLLLSLSVVLALTIGFLSHFQMFGLLANAQEAPTQYVGEVRLYQGATVEAAANACKTDGFTPVKGNLNEGAGNDAVVLGYTTTQDKNAAVTDLRMMQMTSGFSTVNYAELVKRQYPGVDSLIDEEYTTIKEFREKVGKGSYNAKTALQYLNLFKIPELGMKLGDYYLSDSLDKAMLKKLFLQTSATVSTTSYNMLALGVSDSAQDNWASRVYANKDILDVGEKTDDDSAAAGSDPFAELDRKYLSNAERLVAVIQDFATKYQNGMARAELNGGELTVPDPQKASAEEMNAHGSEALYIVAHEILNQHRYDDNRLLGDWLVEMGNLTLSNKAELRNLYPLVAAMSYGQIITAQVVGFQICSYYLTELSASDEKLKDTLKKAQNECRDYDKTDAISVWSGVDQKLFEQECAVTGDAQRYTNLKDTADNLVKRNRTVEVLEAISNYCSILSSLAVGGAALFSLPIIIVGWSETLAAYCIHHFTLYMIFGILGKIAAVVGVASTLVFIVTLVIMLVVYLYETFKPESDELTYTKIPAMAMDLSVDDNASGKSGLLRYDLIHSPDGKADLNAYNGKQWNALYSSQNSDAGKPIVVENDEPFIIKTGNAESPSGYKAVKNFDEIYAANLNANVKQEKAPPIYLFYAAKGESASAAEVKDTDGSGSQQQDTGTSEAKPAPAEKKRYIASLYLSSADSETVAKSKLTQQGYKIVDVNLTPSLRLPNKYGSYRIKSYSYLGYTVTANEKAAITDIRMAKIKSTSRAVTYGTAKYTAAGYDGHGNSICYSKDASVGSPILADDIQVAEKLSDRKLGYEPVSYFGGTVYNFDACSESNQWDQAKYLFFSPSEKYPSGTEYISGLFFVSGNDVRNSGWSLAEYAQKLGGRLLGDADFTKGRVWKKLGDVKSATDHDLTNTYVVSDLKTYLCYTTTYHPKRALYDVQFYAGTPRMQNFAPLITAYTGNAESNYAQTGYGITSVFMQGAQEVSQWENEPKGTDGLYHYEVGNYDDFTVSTGEVFDCFDQYIDNTIKGVNWQSVASQPHMLYVCGSKRGYNPLKSDDLVLSFGRAPEGFASVQDLKSPFETNPLNLAYHFREKSGDCTPVFLYIRRAAPVRGKYIASVSVATYIIDPSWKDEELKANNDFSNDSCYFALLSASTEIVNQSLALLPDQTWYNKVGKANTNSYYGRESTLGATEYVPKATYLGVTYTDNPAKAIHGLLRFKAQDGKNPSETLTVNGAKYTLVKNVSSNTPVPITSAKGQKYYLYATTSSGGSSTGDALSEIQISEKVFERGMSTVLTVNNGDIEAQKDFYGNKTSEAKYAVPFGDSSDVLYIHQKTNASLTGIDSFFVGTGDTEDAAMADLLTQGATNILPLDLNAGTGAHAHVYIGYHLYNPDYVNTRRTKYYMESAVKDLYVYVGSNPPKRLTINKRRYTLCCDRNLNYGTGGVPMYLYQTTALINNKDKKDASYITAIGAAQYDRVPADIAENKWENLLTTENKRINLNEGVTGYDRMDKKQHLVDSRVYVFVHRNDNYVKPEAAITGGYFTDVTVFGDVILSKKP